MRVFKKAKIYVEGKGVITTDLAFNEKIAEIGDDLSGEEWDGRKWRSREGVRYDLVGLCAELVGLI